MKPSLLKMSFFAAALLMPFFLSAQCKMFSKKTCMPVMLPYNHNGQMNNIMLSPGEKAEMMITFYSGQEYRLLVCGQQILGDVFFRVLDKNRNELYNNKNDFKLSTWDFNVASTQPLILEVESPPTKSKTGMMEQGCVSILIGLKL